MKFEERHYFEEVEEGLLTTISFEKVESTDKGAKPKTFVCISQDEDQVFLLQEELNWIYEKFKEISK